MGPVFSRPLTVCFLSVGVLILFVWMGAFVLLWSVLFSPMVFYCFDYLILHFGLVKNISIFNVLWFPIFTLFLFLDVFTTCYHWLIIYTYLPFVILCFFHQTVFEMPGNEPTGTERFSGRTSSSSWSSCSIQDTWNYSGGEPKDQVAKSLTWPMLI